MARRLEQGGVPRTTAMKITGHKTEHVFRQYAVGEDEDIRLALRGLVTNPVTIEEGQ